MLIYAVYRDTTAIGWIGDGIMVLQMVLVSAAMLANTENLTVYRITPQVRRWPIHRASTQPRTSYAYSLARVCYAL